MTRLHAAVLALAVTMGAGLVQAKGPAPESPEFLRRQARLLFEYGKFGEAADALERACADDAVAADPECHADLAVTAERAARIGVAISAWARVQELGGPRREQAEEELGRLRAAYGRIDFSWPTGRSLPGQPITLTHQGFLIDPQLKEHVRVAAAALLEDGVTVASIWLPAGAYQVDEQAVEVIAGGAVAVALDASQVPYRAQAFVMGRQSPPALGGPNEVAVGLFLGIAGVPDGGLGAHPVRPGGSLGLARHFGPLRVGAGARLAVATTRTLGTEPAPERRGAALEVLGALDVGVDLGVSPTMFLTPHIGVLAGTLGSLMVGCVVQDEISGTVSVGECRLPSLAIGGLAGLDVLLLPGAEPRRVGLRVGLAAEFLGAGLSIKPGARLKDHEQTLIRAQRWRFSRLGGVVDVGLALRF